jgi:hypothetical protein
MQWIKSLWIDRRFPEELEHLKHEFAYVPALLQDNPHLGKQYEMALRGLPEKKRKALLEGDWSIPEGQYFTNFERKDRAIHPSVLGQIVKTWWPRWISMDWGFKHHSSIHWHTTGDVMPEDALLFGKKLDAPKKFVFTYREKVVSLAQEGGDEEGLASQIGDRSRGEQIKRFFLSPDAFGKKTSANPTSDVIGRAIKSFGIPYPEPADNQRVVGWRFMYQLIANDAWMISENCPEALNAVPAAEYDKDGSNIEDILKTDHLYDDVLDELRYGLQSMLNNSNKPFAEKLNEAVSAAPNATVAHMVHMKMLSQRKGRERFNGR